MSKALDAMETQKSGRGEMRLHCQCTHNQKITIHSRSRKSVVGKGTKLDVRENTSRFQDGEAIFAFSKVPRPGLADPNYYSKLLWIPFPRVKRLESILSLIGI
jgi:hypothetical protein